MIDEATREYIILAIEDKAQDMLTARDKVSAEGSIWLDVAQFIRTLKAK